MGGGVWAVTELGQDGRCARELWGSGALIGCLPRHVCPLSQSSELSSATHGAGLARVFRSATRAGRVFESRLVRPRTGWHYYCCYYTTVICTAHWACVSEGSCRRTYLY